MRRRGGFFFLLMFTDPVGRNLKDETAVAAPPVEQSHAVRETPERCGFQESDAVFIF